MIQGEDDDTSCAVIVPRAPAEMSCDGVSNPADPDASYNAHKGLGYMAQIVETFVEDDNSKLETTARSPDLITHVAVHKMTVHDGHRLPNALDDLADRTLTPKVLLADSHYGSTDNMTLADERSIGLIAPARTAKGGSSGRLTLEDFSLDEAGLVLECPNGVVPVSTSASAAKLQARFDLAACRACPNRAHCTEPTALCSLINMKGNMRGSNTHQHEPKTGNAGFTNAALHSTKSIVGVQASRRRCHA
jgi:hypothetical protein